VRFSCAAQYRKIFLEDKLMGKPKTLSLAPYTLPEKGLSMIVSFNVQEQSDFRTDDFELNNRVIISNKKQGNQNTIQWN
jgi:hypothetical protein